MLCDHRLWKGFITQATWQLQAHASKLKIRLDIHCPEKFGDQCLVEYLLHGDFISLAPCNRDSRIQVVNFGSAQSNSLEVILDPGIDLGLLNDSLFCIYACLDPAAFNPKFRPLPVTSAWRQCS